MLKRSRRSLPFAVQITLFLWVLTAAAVGCKSRPAQPFPDASSQIATIADVITNDVGEVRSGSSSGDRGTVYVFEEKHTSRIGQIEIAVMLNRLVRDHGVRRIALEGMLQASHPLDASWFHGSMLNRQTEPAQDVAVEMLGRGEISAAELVGLTSEQVEVHGTEIAEEYSVQIPKSGNPGLGYLLLVAQENLTEEQAERFMKDVGPDQDPNSGAIQRELVEFMLGSDPWVKAHRQRLENDGFQSIEQLEDLLNRIEKKVNDLGIVVDPELEASFHRFQEFVDVAGRRTATMARKTLEIAASAPGKSAAMIIGAGHSRGVARYFDENETSYVVIRPLGFDAQPQLSASQFERKNRMGWARVRPGTLGALLEAQRKNPTFIQTATCMSYASAQYAALVVARAHRAGKRVPEDVWSDLERLPELRVEKASFETLGPDVLFRVWVVRTDGSETDAWIRAGTVAPANSQETLEAKLLRIRKRLGDSGNQPPIEPPSNDERRHEEDPGDRSNKDLLLSLVGSSEAAVYTKTRANAITFGQISLL